jgi:FkbM family methyltransferase
LFRTGVQARFDSLYNEYLMPSVEIARGGLVVDCGANIGEFSLAMQRRHGCSLVAIEPDPVEFRALEANLAGMALALSDRPLWSEVREMTLYSANDHGDSSLIKPPVVESTYSVLTQTLDSLLPRFIESHRSIEVLKLEAEGAEPEVLKGGLDVLPYVKWVTADVGPERGLAARGTLAETSNILYHLGFHMVETNLRRVVCLYRNSRF